MAEDRTIYVVQFVGGFRDGNVWPDEIRPKQLVEVDAVTYAKMKQSDPEVTLVEKRVPKASGPTSGGKK